MKSLHALNALLMTMMLSACASSPVRPVEPETRIIEINCAQGLRLDDLAPDAPPPIIEAGQDWRDYGEGLYVVADRLHAQLTAAHGALEDCAARAGK